MTEVPDGFTDLVDRHTAAESARAARSNDTRSSTQAMITAIWDRDVGTLSGIIDHHDTILRFGRAATSRLVQELMEGITDNISQRRESREVFAGRCLSGGLDQILPLLGPVRLAMLIGFLDGVMCLLGRQSQSQQDLLQWWSTFPALDGTVPQDLAMVNFLSYHNQGMTDGLISDDSLLSSKLSVSRYQLAWLCPNPKNDMPGGTKWLDHAIRRGNTAGAYILLDRRADPNAVLADGTSLVKFALANGQDKIAVLLLYPQLATGVSDGHYIHEVLIEKTGGRSSDLARLKQAAKAMKREENKYGRMWRSWLQYFIDTVVWAEASIDE